MNGVGISLADLRGKEHRSYTSLNFACCWCLWDFVQAGLSIPHWLPVPQVASFFLVAAKQLQPSALLPKESLRRVRGCFCVLAFLAKAEVHVLRPPS
jgi:hypothetical protein